MACGVLCRTTHIKKVERTAIHLARKPGDGRDIDVLNAESFCHTRGGCLGFIETVGRRCRRFFCLLAGKLEAGEVPSHRAIFQGHDSIRQARVDERLRTDDAAGAARTIDNHQRVR